MKCAEKVWYPTAALAEKALKELVKKANDKQAAKRLVVYPCRDCGKFHVGHMRAAFVKQPQEHQPSARQRRAVKAVEKSNAKRSRKALAEIGFYFDNLATAANRARMAVDDLNDSMLAAKRLADEIFNGQRPA
ncbi:MAG: hypothetical protein WBX03_15455 [Terriglobales bacterium]